VNVVILFLDNKPHHRSWRNGEGMEESPRESLKRTLTGHGPMGVLRYVQYGFMLSSLVFLAVVTVSYKQKDRLALSCILKQQGKTHIFVKRKQAMTC
jgi:hypothetical protein